MFPISKINAEPAMVGNWSFLVFLQHTYWIKCACSEIKLSQNVSAAFRYDIEAIAKDDVRQILECFRASVGCPPDDRRKLARSKRFAGIVALVRIDLSRLGFGIFSQVIRERPQSTRIGHHG